MKIFFRLTVILVLTFNYLIASVPVDISLQNVITSTGFCGSTQDSIKVIIKNIGTTTQTSFLIKADISGPVSANLSTVYTKTLLPNTIDTVVLKYFNSNISGIFQIKAYLENISDPVHTNDTLKISKKYIVTPVIESISNDTSNICNGTPLTFTASYTGGITWWTNQHSNFYFRDTFSFEAYPMNLYCYPTSYDTRTVLKITEFALAGFDGVEIQNLSRIRLNTQGWKVIVSNSYTDINAVNPVSWSLPSSIEPHQVLYRLDQSATNLWGGPIIWDPGDNAWAILLDDQDKVIDAVFMDWPFASIQNSNIQFNGKKIDINGYWTGNGLHTISDSYGRQGNSDHDNLSDFSSGSSSSFGLKNNSLNNTFPIDSCNGSIIKRTVNIFPQIEGGFPIKGSDFTAVFDTLPLYPRDIAFVGDTLHYVIPAPIGHSDTDYNITWKIKDVIIENTSSGISINGREIKYIISQNDSAKILILKYTVENMLTGCEDANRDRAIITQHAPSYSIGTDTFLCNSDVMIIDSKAMDRVLWSTGETTRFITVNKPGKYWAVIYNHLGNFYFSNVITITYKSATINVDLGPDREACVNDIITLDAGPQPPGYRYAWNAVDTTRTVSFKVTSPGIYSISVKIIAPNGCFKTDTIHIYVYKRPLAYIRTSSPNNRICKNDMILLDISLENDPLPVNSYLWSTGDTTDTIKITQPGLYWCYINVHNCITTAQIDIQQNPDTINASFSYVHVDPMTITVTPDSIYGNTGIPFTYMFDFGNGFISGGNTSFTYTYPSPGTYTLSYFVINHDTGCKDKTFKTVNINTGIDHHRLSMLNIAPNPVTGAAKISFELLKNSSTQLEVFDITGRKLSELINDQLLAGKQEYILNTESLSAGIYLLRLIVDNKSSTLYFINQPNNVNK